MVIVAVESWMELLIISGWGIWGGYDIDMVISVMVPSKISGWGIGSGCVVVGASWMVLY